MESKTGHSGLSETEQLEQLKTRVAQLMNENGELDEAKREAEAAQEHAQAELERLIEAVLAAVEMTHRDGPVAGMDHIVSEYRLLEHDQAVGFPEVPYDWLTRWQMVLA